MAWILICLLSAFLAAAINYTDKYLIEKWMKNRDVGAMLIFSSLIGLPAALLILLFHSDVLATPALSAFYLVINGLLYISWLLPYFEALRRAETSVVAPLFQLSAVFSLCLGFFFLGEHLTVLQIFSGLLILSGAVTLTLGETESRHLHIQKDVLALMSLSSFIIALNGAFFKVIALDVDFWAASFWEYIGFFVAALIIFVLNKKYRLHFLYSIKKHGGRIVSINIVNESMNVVSKSLFNFASLIAPFGLVSLMTEGFQPMFVLTLGLLLTLLFPKVIKERTQSKFLMIKFAAICLLCTGALLLSL